MEKHTFILTPKLQSKNQVPSADSADQDQTTQSVQFDLGSSLFDTVFLKIVTFCSYNSVEFSFRLITGLGVEVIHLSLIHGHKRWLLKFLSKCKRSMTWSIHQGH